MLNKSTQRKSAPREVELDFIRGIAIILVLEFHYPYHFFTLPFDWLGFPSIGWAGVDIFFVLSGFLVGGLLVKEWILKSRIDSKNFLVRRGFKIWPQYYFFIFCALLVGHRTLRQSIGNLLNIQNYIGGIAHTWTLAVEEHAYLALVLILAIGARYKMTMRHLFQLVLGIALTVLTLRIGLAANGYNTFAWTHTRVDGIFYGVLLAILYHHAPERFRSLQDKTWIWLLVITLSLGFMRFRPDHLWWPGPVQWFLADISGVALLFLLYRHRPGRERSQPYVFIARIGLYSYGIYLWHESALDVASAIGKHLPQRTQSAWAAVAPYVFAVLIGALFTKLIEFPALRLRERLFPRRIDSAVGVPAEIELPSESAQRMSPELDRNPGIGTTASGIAVQKTAP